MSSVLASHEALKVTSLEENFSLSSERALPGHQLTVLKSHDGITGEPH